jgi:hypothetical protein
MVLFFGSGDYSFVSVSSLLPFEAGENHEKLCRSSRSKLFVAAVAEASKSLAGKAVASSSKRPRSARHLHLQLHGASMESMHTDSAADITAGAVQPEPIPDDQDSKAGVIACGNDDDDLPHYEILRQENMRRNNEILEVMRSTTTCTPAVPTLTPLIVHAQGASAAVACFRRERRWEQARCGARPRVQEEGGRRAGAAAAIAPHTGPNRRTLVRIDALFPANHEGGERVCVGGGTRDELKGGVEGGRGGKGGG